MLIAIDGLPDGMLIAIDGMLIAFYGLPDGMLIAIDGMLIAIDGLPHQVMLAQMREEGLHREIAVLAARPKVSGWFRRQEEGPADPATPTGSPAGGTGGSPAADAHDDDDEEEDEFDEHQQAEISSEIGAEISAEIDALAAAAATKYASLERDGKVERCERDGAPPREREGEAEGGAPAGGEAEQGGSSAADLPARVAALRAEAAQLDRLSKETGDDALKAQAAAKLQESQLVQAQIDQQGAGSSTAAGGSAGGAAEGMAALQGQLKEARAKIGSLRALLGRAVREHCRASIDLAAREARAPPPPPPPPPSSSTASFARDMDTSFSKDSSARHVEKDTVFLEASSTGGYRDSQGHGLNPMRMTMSDGDGSWDDDDSDDDEEDDDEERASAPSPERTGGAALGAAAGDSFADFGAFGGSPERGAVVGGEPAPAVEGIQNVLRDLALRAEVAGAAESSLPTTTPKLAEFVAFELPAPPTTMPMAPPTAPPSALVSSADFAVFDLPPQGSDSSGGDSSFGDSSSSSGSGGGGEEEGGNKGDDQ
jgi:hypothetical protein